MLTEDYLIRMINLAVAALLEIIGLKKKGDLDNALNLIDFSLERLTGMRSNLIKHLEDERLFYVLTRSEQLDTQRLELVADLFREEGDVLAAKNRLDESRDDYARALRYYLETFFNLPEEEWARLQEKIEALVTFLGEDRLDPSAAWPLAGFYEETGAWGRAKDLLERLAAQPDLRESVLPELCAFYRRLLDQPPEQLAGQGLDRARIQQQLSLCV